MATISFAPSATTEAAPSTIAYSPEQVQKEVAIIDEKPLATQTSAAPNGIEGEITASDIKPPLAAYVGLSWASPYAAPSSGAVGFI